MVCMDYMDPDVHCPQKAAKLTHSLAKKKNSNDFNHAQRIDINRLSPM